MVDPIVIIDKYKPDWLSLEDSGQSLIYELEGGPDEHFFVRLQSSDEEKAHRILTGLINSCILEHKKIKVTIELIDA